ncbi:apyrase-like [Leptopilina heterotoma]|uniref:apyrase-like n=1 Tax=Leptopilina heterotoma TaxID=63436 RepID=UPI001CAA138E|nr:apyrase-like [Leptopilina heterotoma]
MFSSKLLLFKLSLVFSVFQLATSFSIGGSLRNSNLFELSVIHFNDFHARFLQTGPASDICNEEMHESTCIGGVARVYTASKKLLNERPNGIFLNAGDMYQGTIWYNLFKWNVTVEFMNMLPHDAMTIGNHDFDNGIAGLVPFLKHINSPVVVANLDITEEPTLKGLFTNSTIIEKSGRKIGVIGALLSTSYMISRTENVIFIDEVLAINAEAKNLKAKGVEIIIVLSHCGLDIDRIIAANCSDIDIIVGGHSHTFLYTGPEPYLDIPEDEYPVHVKQEESGRSVLIVQASAFTRYIGNLTVWFDSRDEVVNWEGNPILLDHSIPEDPEVLKALKPWKKLADIKGKQIVGSTKVYLDGKYVCRRGECNMGNLITDSMVDYNIGKDDNKYFWTRAAIGVINVGGIRSSISNDPETIRFEDIVGVQPFENTLDTAEFLGRSILKFLEKAVLASRSKNEFVGKLFYQWSGIQVTYNLSSVPYHRVVDVKVRCQACKIPIYEKLNLDKWYRLTTLNFLLDESKYAPPYLNGYRNRIRGPQFIDVLADFIRKKSPITYGTEGRITLLGTWNGK